MEAIKNLITRRFAIGSLTTIGLTNVLEILILSALIYLLLKWIRDTRAWTLFKGILVVIIFALVAYGLNMTTILFLFRNIVAVAMTGIIVLFQPELRRALEQLGRKNFRTLFGFQVSDEKNTKSMEKIAGEIVKACYDMAKTKTGALIVIEREVLLSEYERTGILLDAIVSSQLLINIFEHNTPLHDGAIFIRENRIVAATCYLPLSDNMALSKELGTRHRAGVGISEVSDSLTIIVSEETGAVSIAEDGGLSRNIDADFLKQKLIGISKTPKNTNMLTKWRGMIKNEKKSDE